MKFDHITSDTNQGPWRGPGRGPVEPWLVVRCGIYRSNSLSNSIVNATSTWESRIDKGRPADAALAPVHGSVFAGDCIEGHAPAKSGLRG